MATPHIQRLMTERDVYPLSFQISRTPGDRVTGVDPALPSVGTLRDAGARPGMLRKRVGRLKAESRFRSSLKSLQQSIDIIELDFGTEALASAAAQFIQDLTGFLQSILIGDFDVALIIGAIV
jgi:hypothetical protein